MRQEGHLPAYSPTPPPEFWLKVPVDHEFRNWLTIDFERTVLVIVRTVTTLTRLLDIISLIESDRRIQVVFTYNQRNSAIFDSGIREFLDNIGARVVPWEQAVATRFDLALAASENDLLHEVDAPVLLVSHGFGYQKYYPGSRTVSGMDRSKLVRDGNVIPEVIAVSHPTERTELRKASDKAVSRSVVLGDPYLDRLLTSRHRRDKYRKAFGIAEETLVLLVSTWGPDSLFGTSPELPERLLSELPLDSYRIALTLHSGVWSAHGAWQIYGWITKSRQAGLRIIPVEHDWRSALLAADCVFSDGGSASLYAASLDKPLILAARGETTVANSAMDILTRRSPFWDRDKPIRPQIDSVCLTHQHGEHKPVIANAVDKVGASAERTRKLLYEMLRLAEPTDTANYPLINAYTPDYLPIDSFLVGGEIADNGVAMSRFPAVLGVAENSWVPNQHVVSDVEESPIVRLDAASIVYTREIDRDQFDRWATDYLAHWPCARIAAAVIGTECHIRIRDRGDRILVPERTQRVDPLLLASAVYLRLSCGRKLDSIDRVLLDHETLTFTVHEYN